MLPAAYRLRRRTEFAAAVRAGRRASCGTLVVHLVLPMNSPTNFPPKPTHTGVADAPARVGFVVPRSVGTAVARNRVRRRLRHLMRPRLAGLPPGSAVVVRVLPGAALLPSARLGEQLTTAMSGATRRWTESRPRRIQDRPMRVGDPGVRS